MTQTLDFKNYPYLSEYLERKKAKDLIKLGSRWVGVSAPFIVDKIFEIKYIVKSTAYDDLGFDYIEYQYLHNRTTRSRTIKDFLYRIKLNQVQCIS